MASPRQLDKGMSLTTLLINRSKVAGELQKPNGITMHRHNQSTAINAVFSRPFYPTPNCHKSRFRYQASKPFDSTSRSSLQSKAYASLQLTMFRSRWSSHTPLLLAKRYVNTSLALPYTVSSYAIDCTSPLLYELLRR